ncbi:hypothetical protein [Deinococcus sonorensis]|uniref:Uncharacterized protein n=2 Tax=Deinococcus sonorensis TaxID=309891 RepID=A0AAU7U8A3_9DEIO
MNQQTAAPRKAYTAPQVVALGQWSALTLATSVMPTSLTNTLGKTLFGPNNR